MANERFYPALADVLSTDKIPDALGFIKDGIINLLEGLYFKGFQFTKSPDGAFYSLKIVSKSSSISIE